MNTIRIGLIKIAIALSAIAQESSDVRIFSGPEGLDLAGSIIHAIDFGGTQTTVLSGVSFLPDTAVPELNLNANEPINEWGERNSFGSTTSDDHLATIMHGMRWAEFPAELSFSLQDIDPRSSHKLQLLFAEKCCDRGFDIQVNGAIAIPRFSPKQLGADTPNQGVVVSLILKAGPSEIQVKLRGVPERFPDPSPVIQAATLERLSAETPPPLITLQHTPTMTILSWPSTPGLDYQIEYSASLGPSTWITIDDTIPGTGNTITWHDTNSARVAKPVSFYRLR
ncbi:MAG: hypothetical protein ACI8T1_000402 [Verrucomicrobiales bacterium]|jgi:hypothetical protein